MNALSDVARLAREEIDTMAGRGLSISFHDDMPESPALLHVAVEAIEGRNEREATLIRNRHLFEGGGRDQLPLLPWDLSEAECRARIQMWLARVGQLLVEEAEMRGRGIDPLDPPLSELRASVLVRDVIAWSEFHSSCYRVRRTAQGGIVQPPGGMAWGRIAMETVRRGRADDGITMELELAGRRLHARRIIVRGAGAIRIQDVDERTSEIAIAGVAVPESALAALRGRQLGDIVRHPALDRSRQAIVASAENDGLGDGEALLRVMIETTPVAAHPLAA